MESQIFESLDQHQNHAKKGDFLALEGNGIICGIKTARAKTDFYKFMVVRNDTVYFRPYRSRTNYSTHSTDQKVLVIQEKEYRKLKTY